MIHHLVVRSLAQTGRPILAGMVLATLVLIPALAAAQSEAARPLAERLEQIVEQARELPVRSIFLSPRAAEAEADDLEGIVAFIREHVALEPYRGRLRGARGTLFSRSGNSLDIALLLGAMLEQQGVPWRLAHATLDEAQRRALIETLTPRATLAGGDTETAYDPTAERWIQRHVEDHWWIEAQVGGDWTAVDPVFPGLQLGQAVAEPDQRVTALELAERFAHRVSIRLAYRQGMRPPQTMLSYEADLADLAYRNLVVSFSGEGSRSIRPTLDVGGEVVRGEVFTRGDAERIWLELELGDAESAYRIERELRRPGDALDGFAGGVQVYSLLFLPGWVGVDYYRAVTGALLTELAANVTALSAAAGEIDPEAVDRLPEALQARLIDVLAPMTGLIALSFAQGSDEMVLGLAAQSGVRAFYAQPRVVVSGAVALPEGLAFQLDLRANEISAIPWAGLPARVALGFHALRGRLDAELSGMVLATLTGLPTLSASDLLGAAWDQGRSFTTISATNLRSLDRLAVSDANATLIESDASSGGLVLAPQEPIDYESSPRMAWWRLRSSTGQMTGVLDDGTRGAVSGLLARPGPETTAEASPQAVVEGALAVVEALFSGVLDQARHGAHARDQACPVACDLMRLANSACGDPAAASIDRCLRRARASDDPLGLGLSCADMVDAFRCGSWIGGALVDGRLAIEIVDGEVPWGPWDEPIPPVSSPQRCRCE